MYIYMYMCICVYVYMCICVYVYMYMCIYVYMYICIYVYMYICIVKVRILYEFMGLVNVKSILQVSCTCPTLIMHAEIVL